MDLNIYPRLPRKKDFRIGILGSGFIVNDCHLRAYRKAGFNPVAIASRHRERAEAVASHHGIGLVHDSYEALLNDPSIEVLDLAVPPQAQLGLIRQACARKTLKGILAQKPLGRTLHEAAEAVQLCAAAGITLAVNQSMRYDHSVRAGKTLLETGKLGEPVLATIEMRAIPRWMPWQEELDGLTLRSMSIHHLDAFRYWFGEPEGIYCSVRTDPRTKFAHRDGICTYILEYKSGLRCVAIDDTWSGPAREGCASENYLKWRIEGTEGLAIGDIGWCKQPYTTPSDIRYASKGHAHFECPLWKESWFPDAFIGTMAQLLVALEDGTEPEISGAENLGTVALVEAAYLSALEFRSVELATAWMAIPKELTPVDPAKTAAGRGFFKNVGSALTTPVRPYESRTTAAPVVELESDQLTILTSFTPRARQTLTLAQAEASQLNHKFTGTEHILLGLLKLGDGVAVNVLLSLGVRLDTAREAIEKAVGKGPDPTPMACYPFTPRAKRVLAVAAREAGALNHSYVGTEHILLGLLRESDGLVARLLMNFKVDVERARVEVLKELDPNFGNT